MRRISKKRIAEINREKAIAAYLLEKQKGLCAECGQKPDWRGLSLSHTKPKQMGGTTHQYTADEMQLLCGSCHARKHGMKEVYHEYNDLP